LPAFGPKTEHFTAHQERAFGIDIERRVPSFGLAFVKRAIAKRASADACYIEESVDPAESLEAGSYGCSNCRLVAHIGCSKAGLAQLGSQGTTFVLVYAYDEYGVFGGP
jgi:hypothetical protein